MAGELWSQLKELLLRIDTEQIRAAAGDWFRFSRTISDVQEEFTSLRVQATDTGISSRVADVLLTTAEGTAQALTAGAAALGDTSVGGETNAGPDSALSLLAQQILDLADRMVADETGHNLPSNFYGPHDLTGIPYPTVLSEDPDLRLLQEIRLGQFDVLAEEYAERLLADLHDAVRWIDRMSLEWPANLPQADPAADPASLGG